MVNTMEMKEIVQNLLNSQRLAVLSTLMSGRPYSNLIAFAATDDLKDIFDASAKAAMIYSDTIWLNSENNYLNFLKTKLQTNTLSPEDTAKFAEAAKPVWQQYVDDGSFTWDDINTAQKIAKGK